MYESAKLVTMYYSLSTAKSILSIIFIFCHKYFKNREIEREENMMIIITLHSRLITRLFFYDTIIIRDLYKKN